MTPEAESAAFACADKATRTAGFDIEGAKAYVLRLLSTGPASGEELTDMAKEAGFRGHDDRCYGAVFGSLSQRGLIRCVGFKSRAKGHGTAGARVWALAEAA